MRVLPYLAAMVASTNALAIAIPENESSEALYTIELAPGETKTVTEAEKWALKAEGKHFFDVTDFAEVSANVQRRQAVTFPSAVAQSTAVNALIPKLSKTNLQTTLTTFSNFQNRYYRSTYGAQSSAWLLSQVQAIITASGASNVTVQSFTHSWGQNSIIAKIPGKSTKTIVVGAHQDSINLSSPSAGRAPGADDDGSGSVTILEAFRVLLTDSRIATNQAANTLEFHWYAAEEAGLLGSQAIFASYSTAGRDVKAMLNQDMTGYTQGTLNAGQVESVGVITDYVDTGLTNFIKVVITAYCTIPYVNTQCGYACSDHASANRYGYPSAFVIESAFAYTNKNIHTASDTISLVNFDHVLQHVRMTVGFAYELAFATTF